MRFVMNEPKLAAPAALPARLTCGLERAVLARSVDKYAARAWRQHHQAATQARA